jgi:hypothetical protein
MGKLIERLRDAEASGVYRATRVDPIEDAVRGSKLNFARVRITGKTTFMRDIAAALGFPQWFGENWDALEDCLVDLSWCAAEGHVLVFEGFQVMSEEDVGLLIDVLISAAEFWAEQGRPFFAVFIDPERRLQLADLFREA